MSETRNETYYLPIRLPKRETEIFCQSILTMELSQYDNNVSAMFVKYLINNFLFSFLSLCLFQKRVRWCETYGSHLMKMNFRFFLVENCCYAILNYLHIIFFYDCLYKYSLGIKWFFRTPFPSNIEPFSILVDTFITVRHDKIEAQFFFCWSPSG